MKILDSYIDYNKDLLIRKRLNFAANLNTLLPKFSITFKDGLFSIMNGQPNYLIVADRYLMSMELNGAVIYILEEFNKVPPPVSFETLFTNSKIRKKHKNIWPKKNIEYTWREFIKNDTVMANYMMSILNRNYRDKKELYLCRIPQGYFLFITKIINEKIKKNAN